MTPLFRHPEPDDRPTPGELVGAAVLFVFVLFALWFAAIMSTPL